MENTFRDTQSLSENGMWRGDQRDTCSPRKKNSSTPVALNSTSSQSMVRYLTRPQFSSFFGFSDERGKCVTYRVWWFEVDRAIKENLHSHEVIETRRVWPWSVGRGDTWEVRPVLWWPRRCREGRTFVPSVQFSPTREEVSAFPSCFDNQIRQAKNHGAELLPYEGEVDHHMRLLFC